MNIKRTTSIILALLLMVTALTLSSCGGKQYNMQDCTNIQVTGKNGEGTLTATLDQPKFYANDGRTDSTRTAEESLDLSYFGSSIRYDVSKSNGLSNGDEVTIKVTYDETYAKALNADVKNTEIKYKVSGLK